jgi:hypothetical protein
MLVAPQDRFAVAPGAKRLDPPGTRPYPCHDLPGSGPGSPAFGEM